MRAVKHINNRPETARIGGVATEGVSEKHDVTRVDNEKHKNKPRLMGLEGRDEILMRWSAGESGRRRAGSNGAEERKECLGVSQPPSPSPSVGF